MAWPPAASALTGRIVELTPFAAVDDAGALFAALDSERVWRFLKSGRPADAATLAARHQAIAANRGLPFVVRLRVPYRGLPAGSVVGTSAYLDAVPEHARVEIGATLYAESVWASGVNPECKLLLFGHAFDVLGAGRVHLVTDARNERSQRAIARLGATFEGALRRYERRGDGTVRDTVMFSVIAEDWPDVRTRLEARVAAAVAEIEERRTGSGEPAEG